ncbi:unnamed protein product [Arctia plantaginis]|uniref:Uncharacterized protein n=1 Tax=Arctia plantaginis TaxID=874455 RepID=A0A8S1AET7_ARCPL|nr:unnamed protein product [Arctia plantaginis]
MKSYDMFFVLCALFSFATAAVLPEDVQAKIIKYENSNDGAGNYRFNYETSNGIFRDEIGYLVNVGKEDQHMVVKGSYSYTDVNGQRVYVKYTGDENGFQVNPPEFISQVSYSLPANVVATLLGK